MKLSVQQFTVYFNHQLNSEQRNQLVTAIQQQLISRGLDLSGYVEDNCAELRIDIIPNGPPPPEDLDRTFNMPYNDGDVDFVKKIFDNLSDKIENLRFSDITDRIVVDPHERDHLWIVE